METTPTRKDRILQTFQTEFKVSLYRLQNLLGAPAASIRRDIQGLRREGHNISFAMRGDYTYRTWAI